MAPIKTRFSCFVTSIGLRTIVTIVKSGSFSFFKEMWTTEKQKIQPVNFSSIWILNLGRSRLVFLCSGWAEPFHISAGTGHVTTPKTPTGYVQNPESI